MSERKITFETGSQYHEMQGDTPFAKEFNRRMSAYWQANPSALPQSPQDVMLEMLMDDYDERRKV